MSSIVQRRVAQLKLAKGAWRRPFISKPDSSLRRLR